MADRYVNNLGTTGLLNDGDAYASNLFYMDGITDYVDIPVTANTLSIVYFDNATEAFKVIEPPFTSPSNYHRFDFSFADATPLKKLATTEDITYLDNKPDTLHELVFNQLHPLLTFTRDDMEHCYAGNEGDLGIDDNIYDIMDQTWNTYITCVNGSTRANLKNVNYGPTNLRVKRDTAGRITAMQDVYKFSFNGDNRAIDTKWKPPVDTNWYVSYTTKISNNSVWEVSGVRSNSSNHNGRINWGKSSADNKFWMRFGTYTSSTIDIPLGWVHIVLSYKASTKTITIYINGVKKGTLSNPEAVLPTKNFYYGSENTTETKYPVFGEIGIFQKDDKEVTDAEVVNIYQWIQDNISEFGALPPVEEGCEAPNVIRDCGFNDPNEWLFYVGTEPIPPSSSIVPNSLATIWADSRNYSTEFCIATHCGHPQFQGPHAVDNITTGDQSPPRFNHWYEVDEEGDTSQNLLTCSGQPQPAGCLKTLNTSVNTRVELGVLKGWYMTTDNKWHQMAQDPGQDTMGTPSPHTPVVGEMDGVRQCTQAYFEDIRAAHPEVPANGGIPVLIRQQTSETVAIKPQYYYRYHGFGRQTVAPAYGTLKAIFVQQYMRLIKDDPDGVDDRHLARFVGHVASDYKDVNGQTPGDKGDNMIGRYKRITNDWQPFNALSVLDYNTFLTYPPPFQSYPHTNP